MVQTGLFTWPLLGCDNERMNELPALCTSPHPRGLPCQKPLWHEGKHVHRSEPDASGRCTSSVWVWREEGHPDR